MLTTRRSIDISAAEGYGLLIAQIVYHMPDHHELLQEFIWQKEDVFPRFPRLQKFVGFWVEEIEGPIHSITVAHAALIKPQELKLAGSKLLLN